MLYLIYGTEKEKARDKAHELLETLQKKRPDATVFKMDADNFDAPRFDELIYGQGLFAEKFIVFLNGISENKEAKEILMEKIEAMSEATNAFVLLEGSLDEKSLKALEKSATKVIARGTEKSGRRMEFNIFALGDALGKRDKRELWVLYQKARRAEIEPEEIHGILLWQLRSIAASLDAKSPKEAGLSPFVFQKSARFAKQFPVVDIQKTSEKLMSIYHDSHRGIHDFDIALERFILSL